MLPYPRMVNKPALITQIHQESERIAQMIEWKTSDLVIVVVQKRWSRAKRPMVPIEITLTGDYVKQFYLSREGVIYDGDPDEVCSPVRLECYHGSDLSTIFDRLTWY